MRDIGERSGVAADLHYGADGVDLNGEFFIGEEWDEMGEDAMLSSSRHRTRAGTRLLQRLIFSSNSGWYKAHLP